MRISSSRTANVIGGLGPGESNIIGGNGRHGILLENGGTAAILSNRINDNAALGIELQDTISPAETELIAFSGITVTGIVANAPSNAQLALQIFSSDSCDASGAGEGAVMVGFGFVRASAAGTATFVFNLTQPVKERQYLTATATVASSTSSFSTCLQVR